MERRKCRLLLKYLVTEEIREIKGWLEDPGNQTEHLILNNGREIHMYLCMKRKEAVERVAESTEKKEDIVRSLRKKM